MLKKKKKQRKRNQHKPRRHPRCRQWHVSSRVRCPSVRPSVRHCALSVCVSTGPACQWWLQWQRRARRTPGPWCLGLRPSWPRSPWKKSEKQPWRSPFSSAARHPPGIKRQACTGTVQKWPKYDWSHLETSTSNRQLCHQRSNFSPEIFAELNQIFRSFDCCHGNQRLSPYLNA